MSTRNELVNSIYTGFVDYSEISLEEYQPKLLINNSRRGHKVLTSIINELNKCDEFLFSVAFVTNSGVASLINILEELEYKGVKGKIIASQYQNFTEPRALERLIQLKNLEVRIVVENNFHAKGYIFKKNDSYTLIVGSSNLTQDALSYNKEWNIKVSSMNEGSLLKETINEFNYTFNNAVIVDEAWIKEYEKIYNITYKRSAFNISGDIDEVYDFYINPGESNSNYTQGTHEDQVDEAEYIVHKEPKLNPISTIHRIMPNKMQIEALESLESLRINNKNKALLISAAGTGKTYLSAFDVKKFNPNRFLFIVHRENIACAALKSYQRVLDQGISMGVISGNKKDFDAEYIFSTIQTISKDEIMSRYEPDYFEYIVIDEVHRSGASTYQKVLEYFKPKFLLGMSATPERMDGFDIFKVFDYNIAYEIRLNRALEENMLCPFHYYGISDININGELINEHTAFNYLVSEERTDKIIEKSHFYGCDHGRIKGLIFCSRVEEARELSKMFNSRGYNTYALDGNSSEEEREAAITRLEQDNDIENCLDYIFTVDIFNEGVDIPAVNQIIMLRPTQSSIVFIQQLGRGLRKKHGKEYLVVIDFIGNYSNNFLIPIALYGDNSYNKDNLRKLMNSGNSMIPGVSTINFDYITKQRIFDAINASNINSKKDLVHDYKLLKYKLGKIPSMMDFIEHGSRDPYLFVEYSNSYYNFVSDIEKDLHGVLSSKQVLFLNFISKEIANGKRIEEVLMLKELLKNKTISIESFKNVIYSKYKYITTEETLRSCISNLNFKFYNGQDKKKILDTECIKLHEGSVYYDYRLEKEIENDTFKKFYTDALNYAQYTYEKSYNYENYIDGFILYNKYSRKDVCRILNWEKDESATMYGYRIKYNTCPIFVTYHKKNDISESTKYEDEFLSSQLFSWMTRSKVNMDSKEIAEIKNYKETGLRILLFVKKSDSEGSDFYYMGDMKPVKFVETKIKNNKGEVLPIVNIEYKMKRPVDEKLLGYINM